MKRLLLAVLVTGTVLTLPHKPARADAPIIFGIAAEPYAPFSYKTPSGKWEGFEPDLARALCEEMKAKCKIAEIAWDGIIPALLAHKIDVIFTSMSITAERKKTVAFTIPYYDTPTAVTAPKAEGLDVSKGGLDGKIIGTQIGTIFVNWLQKYYPKNTVKTYETQEEVNADLASGRIDAMICDGIAAETFAKSSAGQGFVVTDLPHDPLFGYGVGAGVRPDDTALKDKLSAAIKAVRANGAYATVDKKYFPVDIWPPAIDFQQP
jgi:polar amino acid transport system substrate-binding protein